MIDLLFFNKDDVYLFTRNDAVEAVHVEDTMQLQAELPYDPDKTPVTGDRVAFFDIDGVYQCFEIRRPSIDVVNETTYFTAEHIAIAELTDELIDDRRPTNASAAQAVSIALDGTQWSLGHIVESDAHSTMFYGIHVWEALQRIQEKWNVALVPRIEIGETGIIGRYIDVEPRRGADRGVRLELDFNLESATVEWDDTDLCTALAGYGKGEAVGETEDGDTTYGRRITFADVEWSMANGDPADKPLGQKWIEDPEATAAFGRNGRIRTRRIDFPDVEMPEELLQATWDALQSRKTPAFTVNASALDLRALGYEGQPLRLGDDVAVIIDPIGIEVKASIVKMSRDLVSEELTKPVIGSYQQDMVDITRQVSVNANTGKEIAAANPSLLQGYIDTMVTRVMSSGTRMDTYKDGGLIFVSEDGMSAVLVTGRGILLSDQQVDGEWQWDIAVGNGAVNASTIRTGILNAALVGIMGSDGTFWDKNYIQITSEEDPLQIMRFGRYDGVHSGLAFSHDGGVTWEKTIGFDGVQYAEMFQLMLNGYIKLGGIEMDGGDHPSFKFEYSGIQAVFIGEGIMQVNQNLQVDGPAYFTQGNIFFQNLPTINEYGNLYIDGNGKAWRGTKIPGDGSGSGGDGGDGGGTTPTQYARTLYNNVNVRSGSSSLAPLIARIMTAGTQVTVTGPPILNELGEYWYPITTNDGIPGYVLSTLIELI